MITQKEASPCSPALSPHQKVRRAALALFAEKGFHSISLRKLAGELGVQAGSIYNHIKSKNSLLFELIDEHESDLLDAIEMAVPRSCGPLESLLAYTHAHLQFNAEYQQRHLVSRLEFRNLNDQQQQVINEIRNAYHKMLERIILHGVKESIFNPTKIKEKSIIIIAMLNELPNLKYQEPQPSFEHVITLTQEMILGSLT
ncbi:TetR/AcrR family transcriptional regulator [Pseudomonas sp. SA3-5]|uniref:TetR/AcrR family transcriptional regulator n=1 Tax=Pseudomonas aestuarii TaxID=3018340 RepID=A0ABT4XDH6_9PSED|nr:TetR/AcrR family transcriptional regulator [Pseudomonas aestuarii]MDA7086244.1 TetR/AcrR family transcriptional regulator [Pseudomonas aestuarii]